MKYKTLNQVTKDYEEKFSKNKQTDEIHVTTINGIEIDIIEQQCGHLLNEAYIRITTEQCSYGMSLKDLVKQLNR